MSAYYSTEEVALMHATAHLDYKAVVSAMERLSGRVINGPCVYAARLRFGIRRPQLAERLRMRVSVNDGGCWEWTGGRNREGYGSICVNGRSVRVHRVSWELHRGPIPHGMLVCHKCDNPPCVNPDHLFLGTDADNVRDRDQKKRGVHPVGEDHGRAKLTWADVADIRARCAAGEPKLAIAAMYGVSRSSVSHIHNRRSWKVAVPSKLADF